MVHYVVEQEIEDETKTDIALQIMEAHADPEFLQYIHDRVQDAVDKDAGYRGSRPLDEPIMHAYPAADLPESGTLIAVDGSQILPNTHGVALYYVLNTGAIIVHQGSGEPPEIATQPYLFYEKGYLVNQDRGIITPTIVSARRNVAEMEALAEYAWYQRDMARPMLALLDGPLLFVMGSDVPDRNQLRLVYFSAMARLMEVSASLMGYTDRPRSRFVVSMLHLLDMEEKDVSRRKLANDGRLEGLRDISVFGTYLNPGDRTALFVQMSPANKEFRNVGGDTHEIVFFYMNVAAENETPRLARVELPMWVASDKQLIAEAQAFIYHQCQQVVARYPYVLTRADELAVVRREEALQFDTMVRVSLTREGIRASETGKNMGKNATRGHKSRHQIDGKS